MWLQLPFAILKSKSCNLDCQFVRLIPETLQHRVRHRARMTEWQRWKAFARPAAQPVLRIRIRDPVLFWPLDPGPDRFFPDSGSQTHIFESLVTLF